MSAYLPDSGIWTLILTLCADCSKQLYRHTCAAYQVALHNMCMVCVCVCAPSVCRCCSESAPCGPLAGLLTGLCSLLIEESQIEESAALGQTTVSPSPLLFIQPGRKKTGGSQPSLEPSDLSQSRVEEVSNIWKTARRTFHPQSR